MKPLRFSVMICFYWFLAMVGLLATPLGAAQEDIQDIQGIIPLAGLAWWIYVLGLVAVVGLAVLIYLLKKKKPTLILVEAYGARALRELDESRCVMQEGMAKEFSLSISEVLRRYMEERFHVPVVQRTTEEFLREMRMLHLREITDHLEELDQFLHLCDQAKFGKEALSFEEMETMWLSARRFVEQTMVSGLVTQAMKPQVAAASGQAL
ncbi:MAG: DUF4381 family protein [Blastochloris sp.]|nr:DUF4381 family protein [Blastochloris sp.]